MVVHTSECPSNSCSVRMSVKLCAARLALQMPAPNPQAIESDKAFMVRVAQIDVLLCPAARWAPCESLKCWRARNDCQHPPERCCLRAGGHPEAWFECYESARHRWELKGALTTVGGCVARCCTLHRCRPTSTLQRRHGPTRLPRLRPD